MPSRSLWLSLGVLSACLALLVGCKKVQPTEKSNDGADPAPVAPVDTGATSGAVSSDYVLFAHLNAKAIREGAVFTDLKQAFAKEGATGLWDLIEAEESRDLGFRPTDLDSATICVTDVPPRELPRFVLILVSSKPFDKTATLRLGAKAKPDARGFYTLHDWHVHFPDDKTVAMFHPDLTQQYLDGYVKDRTGWPFTPGLTKATAGHTAFAILNVQKLPLQELRPKATDELGTLLAGRTVTLTADLKGKELSVSGRATFPDADTAGKAKDKVRRFVGMVADEVGTYAKLSPYRSQDMIALDAFKPIIKGAQAAIQDTKVEATGTDVTLAGGYKAGFDIAKLIADVMKQSREAGPRVSALNNLRQCALALNGYSDTNNGVLPISGSGPKGVPVKNATEKPLLSWRVAILPFIEQGALYKEFKLDEPWDSEHNKKLIAKMPKTYAPQKPGKLGYTHVQMVVGPRAMQPGASIRKISDGTSNTIALVEAAEPVIWTKPDDVMFPDKELPKDFRKKFGGLFPGGFNVALWDGSGRFIPDTMSDRTLALAIDPADGQKLPPEWADTAPQN